MATDPHDHVEVGFVLIRAFGVGLLDVVIFEELCVAAAGGSIEIFLCNTFVGHAILVRTKNGPAQITQRRKRRSPRSLFRSTSVLKSTTANPRHAAGSGCHPQGSPERACAALSGQ